MKPGHIKPGHPAFSVILISTADIRQHAFTRFFESVQKIAEGTPDYFE
jgi:hypothetical protein